MLAFGVLLFLLGSVAGAAAPALGFLIAARALQGVGAAALVPASLALIARAYEPRERGFPLGVWGAVASIGSILGPLVGGFVIERAGWRWAVVSTAPVGACALLFMTSLPGDSRRESDQRVDWRGSLRMGLSALRDAFRATSGSPALRAACLTAFLHNAAAFGALPYVSAWLQGFHMLPPARAGLVFVPSSLAVAVLMPVVGKVVQRTSRRAWSIAAAGCSFTAVSWLLLTLDLPRGAAAVLSALFVFQGFGIALGVSATSFAATTALGVEMAGIASGAWLTSRLLGTAAGVVLGGLAWRGAATTSQASVAFEGGIRRVALAMAVVALAGAVASLPSHACGRLDRFRRWLPRRTISRDT
jgi:MFS family permease